MSNGAASLINENEIFKQIHKTFTSCATVTCGLCQGCTNPWRQVAGATSVRGFSVELASCYLRGAQNFKVGSRLEKVCVDYPWCM
jgi:radical SAM superfamily enzyme with C-terminal helix-hairpin-helix motif